MKYFIQVMLVVLGLCCGCSKSSLLTPAQFTREFADALHQAAPDLKVETVHDLQLTVTPPSGNASSVFLDNAYDLYKQNPSAKADVFQKYIASDQESIANAQMHDTVDRDHIIPIVKDRPWLDEMTESLRIRGNTNQFEEVHEDLNPELIILYAEDSPKAIRYLTPDNLIKNGLDRSELRSLASKNLMNLIPPIQRHGTNGFYALDAGGNYEASLLVVDSVWTDLQKDVRGDVVVAIPTRDILMVTGSNDQDGLGRMKKMVDEAYAQGSYRLTDKLFVYREGRFVLFTGQ